MADDLKELIKKGIIYEDEFMELYLKLIRDEGFMEFFGAEQTKAKQLLNVLISESQEHKATLENIINNLK